MNRKLVFPPIPRRGVAALCLLAAALVALASLSSARADSVTGFDAVYTVNPDGTVDVVETITYDAELTPNHGIDRDLVTRQGCPKEKAEEQPIYPCPPGSDRLYRLTGLDVQLLDAAGRPSPVPWTQSDVGDGIRLRIGDPDTTFTGERTSVVSSRIERGLTAYPSHVDFSWNATGNKSVVSFSAVRATVKLPPGVTPTATACYQGLTGVAGSCRPPVVEGSTVIFTPTRLLGNYEGMTVAVGFPTNAGIAASPPLMKDRVSIDDFFAFDALEIAGAVLVGLLSIAGVVLLWWRHGRDRQYRTLYYLTNDPHEGTRPLFSRRDIVVEYLPPEGLRPAEMGLILDERADTRDVTATIVDLAVRGYLHITEIPKQGRGTSTDWEIEKLKPVDADLRPYEARLHNALFRNRESVKISSLKTKFAGDLGKVKDDIYDGGRARGWFVGKPTLRAGLAIGGGIVLVVLGAGAAVATGWFFGRALIGAPLALAGIVLLVLGPAMGKRTAPGSEALRRVLGFRLYVATAETRQHEFNEQQNIFARYLPYAIVFDCVDKWAKAFSGLDDPELTGTAGWYTGVGAFHVATFSAGMNSFSRPWRSSSCRMPRTCTR